MISEEIPKDTPDLFRVVETFSWYLLWNEASHPVASGPESFGFSPSFFIVMELLCLAVGKALYL